MEFEVSGETIRIKLPITMPTSKVRVKRLEDGLLSSPVACRSYNIEENDYLEWQIGYDTLDLHQPSILKDVILQKDNGTRYGYELTALLVGGLKIGLITEDEISTLKALIEENFDRIEETEEIELAESPDNRYDIEEKFGFKRYVLRTPDYLKKREKYNVEIKIAHKQRAVGNQAMIFLNLPIRFCQALDGSSLIGRIAEKKERIQYIIDKTNRTLIYDTLLAFIIGSKKHRDDIKLIFTVMEL